MAASLNTGRKQRCVRDFIFWFHRVSAENIHKRWVNIYRKAAFDVSTISKYDIRNNSNPREKWGTYVSDRSHNGRPAAAVNKTKQTDAPIIVDVIVRLQLRHGSVCTHGCKKVCFPGHLGVVKNAEHIFKYNGHGRWNQASPL